MSGSKGIHFEISERKLFLRLFDVIVVLAALHLVGVSFDFDYFKINDQHWLWTFVLAAYLLFFASVFELYQLQKASRITSTLKGVISTSSLTSLVYLLTPFFTPELPENRLQILYFYIAITLSLLLWRALYIKLFASHYFNKNILIIADSSNAGIVAQSLREADPNLNIAGFINTQATKKSSQYVAIPEITGDEAQELLLNKQLSEVIVASEQTTGVSKELYHWLIRLTENGVLVREFTQVYEEMTDRVPVQYIGKDFYKYFPFARNNQNKLYIVYHRLFDLVFSIIGLAIGLMLLPFIITGNLIANRGALFYKQERIGKNRRPFQIIKFRTMIKDAEAAGAQFAQVNDSRITGFGKFLRQTRLDEIPQFFNILKGEMSIIGPRPERPIFIAQLCEKIPFYDTRHIVKPGLTGWAQVKTKYGSTDEDHLRKLQYDLFYIKRRSVYLDLRIIVKTLSTIIHFKGQ